jgi:hypothetical protein
MKHLLVFSAFLIATAIISPKVEAFETTGKGFIYLCGEKLTKMNIEGSTNKYEFKGKCSIVVKDSLKDLPLVVHDVPFVAKCSYDGVYAKEIVELANGSSITSTKRCQKDPFRYENISECIDGDPNNAINISPMEFVLYFELMVPKAYPLMARAVTEQAIASAKSPLTEEDPETVDISNWNPFAEVVGKPAAIEIQAPNPYATLSADTPYDVTVNKKSRSAEPENVHIIFERLEKAPEKVGDVALPVDKTHWWVPQWASTITWSSLPFQVGTDRTTKVLTNEGIYRVRVRATQMSGDYLGGWTGWRVFCVGETETCANAKLLSQLGDETQQLFHQMLQEKSLIKKP